MRKFIRNGGITHKETYEQPRNIVWEEVQNLDRNMITFHDRDIKEIALLKAREIRLIDFKASKGWIYYFKKEHALVSRHIDKTTTLKSVAEHNNLDEKIKNFKETTIPEITQTFCQDKVHTLPFFLISSY